MSVSTKRTLAKLEGVARQRSFIALPASLPSFVRPTAAAPSEAHILSHHPSILVFEDVTVIHEGMFPRRGLIKGNQKLGLVLDENHVLPTCQMSRRRCAAKGMLKNNLVTFLGASFSELWCSSIPHESHEETC